MRLDDDTYCCTGGGENALSIKMEAKHLTISYNEIPAVKDVSMPLERCKITAIIGPSGCGKSTFLRGLNRLNDLIPEASIDGKLLLDGKDIYANDMDPVELRKRVGMVFQRPNPFPMSIYDNVAYGPRVHGTKDRKVLDQIVEESLQAAFI